MAAFIGWPFLFMTAIGAALTACQTFRVSIATSFILRFGIEVSVDSRWIAHEGFAVVNSKAL